MGYKHLEKKVKTNRIQQDAIITGVQALLRDAIKQEYRQCKENGYATIADRDNMNAMYEAYKALDGNGVATDLVNRMMAMPVGEDEL